MAKHEEYFIKVPKDIAQIKQKFMFGLTKRQCICFGIGILVGFPAFYLCYRVLNLGLQISCFALGISASPFVIFSKSLKSVPISPKTPMKFWNGALNINNYIVNCKAVRTAKRIEVNSIAMVEKEKIPEKYGKITKS